MKISILCTDDRHPVMPHLESWKETMQSRGHEVLLTDSKSLLPGGDILFLVSCSELIIEKERSRYYAVLVLHASELPKGRGWSPHIWSILNGENEIEVCLLEADDPVDSGDVWLRQSFALEGHELLPEINQKLFATELSLMTQAVEQFYLITPEAQRGDPGPYLRKRIPLDSRLDPYKTLAEQFDLMRVADPDRYPTFLDFRGKRYLIKIEKVENHNVKK
jgi:methionyl-tRNA formyltransferase